MTSRDRYASDLVREVERAGPRSSSEITAPLTVQVDQVCAGRESNIKVLIDFVQIGVANPGEPGVSLMVRSAIIRSPPSHGGARCGDRSRRPAGGSIERLGCMPADAI
jgi:hypothetical protein